MVLRVKGLTEDLRYFHDLLFDPWLMKTTKVAAHSEQTLSRPLRFYLAGIHVETYPESPIDKATVRRVARGDAGRPRRIDFCIDRIALEVASLSAVEAGSNPGKLKADANRDEIEKLSTHSGSVLLALFDLRRHRSAPSIAFLSDYRSRARDVNQHRSEYNFNVAYFYRVGAESRVERIRVYQKRRT